MWGWGGEGTLGDAEPVLALAGVPWASVLLLIAGLAVLGFVIWQSMRKGTAESLSTLVRLPRRVDKPPAADEGAREVEDLVRQLTAELDQRANRLERLIAEADDRLTRLGQTPPADRSSDRDAPAGVRPAREAPRPVVREQGDPVTRRIYSLADEGLVAVDIARQIEQPTGKVELILALRGR